MSCYKCQDNEELFGILRFDKMCRNIQFVDMELTFLVFLNEILPEICIYAFLVFITVCSCLNIMPIY